MATEPSPVGGYPLLAYKMAAMPEAAILRRFAALNARNLLYYQAELVMLENDLCELEGKALQPHQQHEHNARPTSVDYLTDWCWLGELDADNEQWQVVLRIRALLKEYSAFSQSYSLEFFYKPIARLSSTDEAVLLQAKMAALSEPSGYDLNHIRQHLDNQILSNRRYALKGQDRYIWGTEASSTEPAIEPAKDLVTILARSQDDPFSSWIAKTCTRWTYRNVWCRIRARPGTLTLHNKPLLRVTSILTAAIASLLPVGSIAVLYNVHEMRTRLWLVAAFTVTFSLALACFTTCRRGEMFAATAA